jgi:acetone carboxylase gamma subunit
VHAHACATARLRWRQKANIRGSWAGCCKMAETFPSSTANPTNRAERRTSSCADLCFAKSVEIEFGHLQGFFPGKGIFLRRFGPDFIGLYLDWKKIRSETALTKCSPKRRQRLYSSTGKINIGNSPGHECGECG